MNWLRYCENIYTCLDGRAYGGDERTKKKIKMLLRGTRVRLALAPDTLMQIQKFRHVYRDNNLILFKRFSLPDDWFHYYYISIRPQGLNTNYVLLSYIYGRHYVIIIHLYVRRFFQIFVRYDFTLWPFPYT